jgi:hypothetical protein
VYVSDKMAAWNGNGKLDEPADQKERIVNVKKKRE